MFFWYCNVKGYVILKATDKLVHTSRFIVKARYRCEAYSKLCERARKLCARYWKRDYIFGPVEGPFSNKQEALGLEK